MSEAASLHTSASRHVCGQDDQLRDAHGALLLPVPEGWGGVPVGWHSIPGQELRGPTVSDTPTLLMATEGTGRRFYRCGLRSLSLHTAPRMIELYGAGYEMDRLQWQGEEGRCLSLSFGPALLQRLLHDGAPHFQIRTRHEVFDERIGTLAMLLLQEARAGGRSGALYAEGLTLALIACLQPAAAAQGPVQAPTYGPTHGQAAERRTAHLSPAQRQRVVALVDSHLGEDLSVSRLAAEVALSPFHFARAFKGSFGTTPHRYVQQQRITRALQWLRQQPHKPIVEIALELGFASQAHFTEVFRRTTGRTPARVRAG